MIGEDEETMKWQKAPEELKAVIEKAMKGIDCQKKLMFGYPAWFINGHMFAGLFQSSVFLRLSADQATGLRKKHPSLSFLEPMPGRPMKDYFVLPEAVWRDESSLRRAAGEAADHARSLPPKEKTAKKKARREK